MRIWLVLSLMLLSVPAYAETTPAAVPPAATPVTVQMPTEVQVQELLQLIHAREMLSQQMAAGSPTLMQSFQNALATAAKGNPGVFTEDKIKLASQRLVELHNAYKAKMYDWAMAQYVAQHRQAYTAQETQQLIDFYKTPVGQKYVKSDTQMWLDIFQKVFEQMTKYDQPLIIQAFRDAGLMPAAKP